MADQSELMRSWFQEARPLAVVMMDASSEGEWRLREQKMPETGYLA
jgi:DUF438 domain-containing protein